MGVSLLPTLRYVFYNLNMVKLVFLPTYINIHFLQFKTVNEHPLLPPRCGALAYPQ